MPVSAGSWYASNCCHLVISFFFRSPCIITRPPPVQPAGNYGDGMEDPIGAERIHSFESTFDITETGIHRPKIVVCLGTKGGRYRQLVKGVSGFFVYLFIN